MTWPVTKLKGFFGVLVVLLALQGCVGSKTTVEMMPAPESAPVCSEILTGGLEGVSDHDLAQALDSASGGMEMDRCWKPVMKRALMQNREIPMRHLAKAVHVFNRNGTREYFSAAVYQYLRGVVNGKGVYRAAEQHLLEEYLRFSIKNARTRHDPALEKARLVCSRLDPQMYDRFFR